MLVVSLEEGAFVGRLEDFQFDLQTHQIYGWRLKKTGMFSRVGGLPSQKLVRIGREVALLESEQCVEWSTTKSTATVGRAWASTYNGVAVMSRRGVAMGAVSDFIVDVAGNEVTGLILRCSEGSRLLPLTENVQTGPDVIIIRREDLVVMLPDEEEEETWWQRLRDVLLGRKADEKLALSDDAHEEE